jgi:hypothetical protein
MGFAVVEQVASSMSNVAKPLLQIFGTAATLAATAFGTPAAGAAVGAGVAALGLAIDKTQQNTRQAQPAIGGNAAPNTIPIAIDTSFKPFAHKLGRKWSGFNVIENPTGIGVSSRRGKRDELFIELSGSASGNITIQVF